MMHDLSQPRATLPQTADVETLTELTTPELTQQYMATIYGYIARRIPQRQEAEDLTAEVFATAFESLSRFRGQGSVRAWLLGIARHKIIDYFRRLKARPEMVSSDMDFVATIATNVATGPEESLQRAEARRVLRQLLSQLTPEQQEALLLQYEEELSVAEIARVMRRSPAAVTGLLQRARAMIFRLGSDHFLGDNTEAK